MVGGVADACMETSLARRQQMANWRREIEENCQDRQCPLKGTKPFDTVDIGGGVRKCPDDDCKTTIEPGENGCYIVCFGDEDGDLVLVT